MYIDNFQFADLKQNTVPYIAVMHFGAWLLFFAKGERLRCILLLCTQCVYFPRIVDE